MNIWTPIIILSVLFTGYIALAYCRAKPLDFTIENETRPETSDFIRKLWRWK